MGRDTCVQGFSVASNLADSSWDRSFAAVRRCRDDILVLSDERELMDGWRELDEPDLVDFGGEGCDSGQLESDFGDQACESGNEMSGFGNQAGDSDRERHEIGSKRSGFGNPGCESGDQGCVFGEGTDDMVNPLPPWRRCEWDAKSRRWMDDTGEPVETRRFLGGWSVLQMLGVHGCRCIDEAIVAGLALDNPVLLIGAPGSAKTAMTQRIAQDLGMRYWAYDASKAMFEDIVGFPDPASLAQGKVVYVPTPLSLVDKEFILVDEVSRANPGLQNKWLEIIRAHQVMGMELSSLRTVFGAMNPAGLAGTVPLDEALAGRFTFHINVPEAQHMSNEDRRTVMEAPDGVDAAYECEGSRLHFIVEDVRDQFKHVFQVHGARISEYLNALSVYMASKEWPLDGRRLGMMHRGLVALLAARRVIRGQDVAPGELGSRELPRLVLDGGHRFAMAALRGKPRSVAPSDFCDAVISMMNGAEAGDRDAMSQMVTKILQAIDSPRDAEITIKAGAALFMLLSSQAVIERLPLESRQRVIIEWADMMNIQTDNIDDFLQDSRRMEVPASIHPDRVDGFLRLSFSITHAICASSLPNIEFESVVAKMGETIVNGGAE